jgi:hypothetical protein
MAQTNSAANQRGTLEGADTGVKLTDIRSPWLRPASFPIRSSSREGPGEIGDNRESRHATRRIQFEHHLFDH